LKPTGEQINIQFLHQVGGRYFRREVAASLKRSYPAYFNDIEPNDLQKFSEDIADRMEDIWIDQNFSQLPKFDFPIN